jgi:hypothetical protein
MNGPNTPETEHDAQRVQDRRRFRALQSLTAQCKSQTSATKKQPSESSLAMPVDQESSLFSMTPQQHQKMVEQTRAEFLSAKKPSTQET